MRLPSVAIWYTRGSQRSHGRACRHRGSWRSAAVVFMPLRPGRVREVPGGRPPSFAGPMLGSGRRKFAMTRAGTAEPPEPARREPRGFPLRGHIVLLFAGLILAAGFALVGYGYVSTSRLLLTAGDEEFAHVADRTAGLVRELLSPANLLVQLLARHRLTETTSLGARLESLPLLTAALTEHQEISAVYFGFPNGDFFLVRTLRHPFVRARLGSPPNA